MIPAKIEDVFIEISTSLTGEILEVSAGNFLRNYFKPFNLIYGICPFLEGTLEALTFAKPFFLEGMLIVVNEEEFNVDVELFKENKVVKILIHNRTNVYKIVDQLNQNRNDIFFIKRELAEKNLELAKLRKIAERANEEKSRFLAMMSHEIRNPLNVVLGYSEMIAEEQVNDNVKQYSKLLLRSGKNLKVIINDILDLSRIEAGKFELVNSEMDLKELLENAIKNYKHQNKNKHVSLVLSLPNEMPKLILGDAVRLNQILSNLLSNALKFTEVGVVSLKVTIISENDESIAFAFAIKDSGRGMTQEQTATIFNEYQQNEANDYRFFGGAGLGLSIVKRLLEAMEGSIYVDSQLEKGTVFTVNIQFNKVCPLKAVTIQREKNIAFKSLMGLRILVADDDALNQTIVAHILKKEKVILTQVKDGLEALNMLKDEIFDVVVLDIYMPNITGEALVQQRNSFKLENTQN